MKLNPCRTWYSLATLLGLLGCLLPGLAQIPSITEPLARNGKTEIYGIGQFLSSGDITYDGPYGDLKVRMDNTGLGGFGIAYHFNDFFSVHGDFMFGGATFHANVPTEIGGTVTARQDAFLNTGRFNVDYNIINRRMTPFVTAGIGYQYMEMELSHLPPVDVCWWDPWWGWVCGTGYPTAWETDFTWNVGAGVRWNITDQLFIKAMGGATWLEYSGSRGITTQIEAIFSIGWAF